MPYGLPKNLGGDSEQNVKWMERCVNSVMSKNSKLSKESAIRICKKQFIKTRSQASTGFIYTPVDLKENL